jgi:hypothetical protein
MKFDASLPAIAELKVVCVAFEGDRATVVVQARDATGSPLHAMNVIVTDGKSQRLQRVPGAPSYEKSFSIDVADFPGMLTRLKANVDGAEEVIKELLPE